MLLASVPSHVSATTNTRLAAGSITGVEVIPTVGEISPQGNWPAGTAVPTLTCHTTCPVDSLSAYTESFSVATTTNPPYTNGCPHRSPSTLAEVQAEANGTDPELLESTPERPASPRYVVQSPHADATPHTPSATATAANTPAKRLAIRAIGRFCNRNRALMKDG